MPWNLVRIRSPLLPKHPSLGILVLEKRLEKEKPEEKRDNDALFIAVASNTDLVMFCTNGWGMTIVWLSSG